MDANGWAGGKYTSSGATRSVRDALRKLLAESK